MLHSSYVSGRAQWVDSERDEERLQLLVKVQEVKVDLLKKDRFGSAIKYYKWCFTVRLYNTFLKLFTVFQNPQMS